MANRRLVASEDSGSERSDSMTVLKCCRFPKPVVAAVLLVLDTLLTSSIIAYVPYTKIDWDAYMSQVSGFLAGERNYENLKGDTGPLVYPAGFLYVYSAIQYFTGGNVFPAQVLFGALYIVNLGLVFLIYVKTDVLPWWAFCLLCLSKRIHSIFVLRLFNDCFAMTFLHAALALILYQRWHLGLIVFSGAVSIKMNVLLYAPPLLLLLLKGMHVIGVVTALFSAALVQIALGLPFLLGHPLEYVSRAFNLGRVFIHFWSVNFKFIPEDIFVSKEFAVTLLAVHLMFLALFAHFRWCKHEGGLFQFLLSKILELKHRNIFQAFLCDSSSRVLSKQHIATLMFTGNFIGIVCARSLHYQFYSWRGYLVIKLNFVVTTTYFYSLPFLLWKTPFPSYIRLMLFAGVEFCWNLYPSHAYSSLLLLTIHLAILCGLWIAPCEPPYQDTDPIAAKKD